MVSFVNDYGQGAHPEILKALFETNLETLSGYGEDFYSLRAAERIKAACKCSGAQIRILSGGTQTNAIIIASLLKEYEGVIAATTGHISIHEAGAIECTGHKVIELTHTNGKLEAGALRKYLADFYATGNREHMVIPGMVYISHPTELGTIYKKAELAALYAVCREYGIPLFIDGARLGYALTCRESDMTLADIAENCDVFYIGGTKCGALIGEAAVFTKGNMPSHFITTVKRHGALLAKGRITGIQFDVLFDGDLYFDICRSANIFADRIKRAFLKAGFDILTDSPTNQQFPILTKEAFEKLSKEFSFVKWEALDDGRTATRFVTSWATSESDIEALEKAIEAL